MIFRETFLLGEKKKKNNQRIFGLHPSKNGLKNEFSYTKKCSGIKTFLKGHWKGTKMVKDFNSLLSGRKMCNL